MASRCPESDDPGSMTATLSRPTTYVRVPSCVRGDALGARTVRCTSGGVPLRHQDLGELVGHGLDSRLLVIAERALLVLPRAVRLPHSIR